MNTGTKRAPLTEADPALSSRLLAAIVESSDDAIISKSLDGIIRTWNAGAERIFGYTAEQAIGKSIALIIPPERFDSEESRIISQLKAGQRIDHFETERLDHRGRTVRVSLTISPIRDETGKVIGASKIARDITKQREAEERERVLLRETAEANAKFRAFFEQGAQFSAILDRDGTVVEVNRDSGATEGYPREQIVGRAFWASPWWTGAPDRIERMQDVVRQAAAGQPFRGEVPYRNAQGAERIADLNIVPVVDRTGDVRFIAVTGGDITDRKHAESERQKFVTLVENSTDFIGMCDLDFVPFYVNAAGLRMVGLDTVAEAQRALVADFFPPEDRPRVMTEFLPSVAAEGHGEIEVRFRHFKTGETRWMAYKALLLRDQDDRPMGYATVSQDITDRKRLEEGLRDLAGNLSQANRRMNVFLATLAHELRNPLAPLANTLEILRRPGGGGVQLEESVDTMHRQLGQVVRLVDDLLDLSRITHDRLELRKDRVELATVVRQAVTACLPMAHDAGHRVDVSLPSTPVYLYADAARLTQVFSNLLHNSCKYTPHGGAIRVIAERQGEQAVVVFEDDGIGIPADKLQGIFEMFEQVESSIDRSQGGLGIGLTLVQRLVQMHGGTVEARSAGIGQGSRFEVRLPAAAGAPCESLEPPEASEQPLEPRRILVVDDNRDAATSLSVLLELSGHEVRTAHDGPESLELAEHFRPELVLLDIGLPSMSGYDVCRRLRQRSWGHDPVVIALTGWGQDADRLRSVEAGFDGHLVKPVDYATLVDVARRLLMKRETG